MSKGLSDEKKWEVYSEWLAKHFFAEPHPRAEDLVELLEQLKVPLERLERLINNDIELDEEED